MGLWLARTSNNDIVICVSRKLVSVGVDRTERGGDEEEREEKLKVEGLGHGGRGGGEG
jgi:hypothetical protein